MEQAVRLRQRFPSAQVIVADGTNIASARNAALRSATGQWILWVDSDDDLLLGSDEVFMAMSTDADVVVWNFESFWPVENRREIVIWNRANPSPDDFARDVLADSRLSSILWGRLWKRHLFDGLRFDETLTELEDYALMPQLLARVRSVVSRDRIAYRYRRHRGSLSSSLALDRLLRGIEISKARVEHVPAKWRRAAEFGVAQMSSYLLVRRKYKGEVVPDEAFQSALGYIRRHILSILVSSHIRFDWKLRYLTHALSLWKLRQFFR